LDEKLIKAVVEAIRLAVTNLPEDVTSAIKMKEKKAKLRNLISRAFSKQLRLADLKKSQFVKILER